VILQSLATAWKMSGGMGEISSPLMNNLLAISPADVLPLEMMLFAFDIGISRKESILSYSQATSCSKMAMSSPMIT